MREQLGELKVAALAMIPSTMVVIFSAVARVGKNCQSLARWNGRIHAVLATSDNFRDQLWFSAVRLGVF